MRIVVNSLPALKPRSGIGAYVANLMGGLRRLAEPGSVLGFPGGALGWLTAASYRVAFQARQAAPAAPTARPAAPPGWAGRVKTWAREAGRDALERAFRWSCTRKQFQLYHEPNFIPWQTDLPTLVTVADLSVLRFPQYHPRDRVSFHERHFRRGLEQGHHFVTISEFVRQELIEVAGVAPERVSATLLGVAPEFRPLPTEEIAAARRRLNLPEQYLLAVGTIEPRKNLHFLLRTWCSLPVPVRRRFPLVLVGAWGWNCAEVADYFRSVARPAGALHLGHLPDGLLPAVYGGARALLYPSHYEGFGLPPLEMMACGGAVLASDCGAHREVLAGRPGLLDPNDGDAWRNALYRVCTDADFWGLLRAGAAEYAGRYTWEECARQTLAVYARLCRAA